MKKINPNTLKSFLFSPAIKNDFVEKLLSLKGKNKPDAIIFDLEDSVAENNKEEARDILLQTLFFDKATRNALFNKYCILVRINKYGTRWFKKDIEAIKLIKPNFIRLAKVETGKEIHLVRKFIKNTQIAACIESLKGYSNLDSILKALKPADLFNLGFEDLSGELMIERPDRLDLPNPLSTILMNCIIAARKYKITMIDSVSRKFKTVENLAELKRECKFTSSFGLTGKTAIHPSQISTINKIFDSKEKIKSAQKGLDQFNSLTGGTFVTVTEKYEMKDTPSYKMYHNILTEFK